MDDMVKEGHKDAIKTYKKAENDIQDGDVRSFIEQTLPELQMHLDSAQAIQEAIKGNNNGMNPTNMSPPQP